MSESGSVWQRLPGARRKSRHRTAWLWNARRRRYACAVTVYPSIGGAPALSCMMRTRCRKLTKLRWTSASWRTRGRKQRMSGMTLWNCFDGSRPLYLLLSALLRASLQCRGRASTCREGRT